MTTKWCPVCVFYVSNHAHDKKCNKCDNECPSCGNQLESGKIPDYMVSSVQ